MSGFWTYFISRIVPWDASSNFRGSPYKNINIWYSSTSNRRVGPDRLNPTENQKQEQDVWQWVNKDDLDMERGERSEWLR